MCISHAVKTRFSVSMVNLNLRLTPLKECQTFFRIWSSVSSYDARANTNSLQWHFSTLWKPGNKKLIHLVIVLLSHISKMNDPLFAWYSERKYTARSKPVNFCLYFWHSYFLQLSAASFWDIWVLPSIISFEEFAEKPWRIEDSSP